jgi:hypothetical protein
MYLILVSQAVDTDKDGVISVEEFKLFFECLGLEEKVKKVNWPNVRYLHFLQVQSAIISFPEELPWVTGVLSQANSCIQTCLDMFHSYRQN